MTWWSGSCCPGPRRPAARPGTRRSTAPPPSANGSSAGPARRLIAAAYRSEQEAADKVLRLGPGIDACLFASQVPYEYARRAGSLRVPGTYVPLAGSALFAALLRACRELGRDLSRISVDVLSRADIEDAFSELGVPAGGVHVREDVGQRGDAGRLPRAAVPAGRDHRRVHLPAVRGPAAGRGRTFRSAPCARPAARSGPPCAPPPCWRLAAGWRRPSSAVALVEVPTLRDTSRRSSPRHAREELRLTVHRFLVQEAQRMHATVSPVSDHCFLVTATRGSLAAATDGFRVPPFSERARTELGIAVEVGIGMGRTAQDAEAHAQAALSRSHVAAGTRGFALDREGMALVPSPRHPAAPAADPVRPRGLETLSRLADKLAGSDSALVVDAETAGRVLGVTARTARRLLHGLVEEGLAWPLPPSRAPQPGRPRQFYRLVTEKLDRRAPR